MRSVPSPANLALNARLRVRIAGNHALQRSPEQIANDLAERFATDDSMRVSLETIYRSQFIQTRGQLKREIAAHLRTRRRMRQARKCSPAGQGPILEAISIRERPAEVADHA